MPPHSDLGAGRVQCKSGLLCAPPSPARVGRRRHRIDHARIQARASLPRPNRDGADAGGFWEVAGGGGGHRANQNVVSVGDRPRADERARAVQRGERGLAGRAGGRLRLPPQDPLRSQPGREPRAAPCLGRRAGADGGAPRLAGADVHAVPGVLSHGARRQAVGGRAHVQPPLAPGGCGAARGLHLLDSAYARAPGQRVRGTAALPALAHGPSLGAIPFDCGPCARAGLLGQSARAPQLRRRAQVRRRRPCHVSLHRL
mmetsp:Transcript_39220/g.73577  ORF Transcript_39220/g.73577 Transcript_39220/m.73577 type:complete len:258 (-) Transcript_39220:281-1054(-)